MQFTFERVDPTQPSRLFSVTMDVTGDLYLASDCTPPLPELPGLVATLNETRDFYGFVKHVRQRFAALVL